MIALGADHGGYEIKEAVKKYLEENGVEEYLLWNAGNRYTEGALK